MGLTKQEITLLVNAEIANIKDPIIVEALKPILVEPSVRQMGWDYGPEEQTHPCWVVARDEDVNTELVYSEHGFGPETPWGLAGISYNSMGMDSGWFTSLADAFSESRMAGDLRIWDVIELTIDGQRLVLAGSLGYDDAQNTVKEYRKSRSQPEKLWIERRKDQEQVS